MTKAGSIYVGTVMHRRLRPKPHSFRYSVHTMLVDIDALPALGRSLRLFSHNRFNPFSIHDKDLGDKEDLKNHLRKISGEALGAAPVERFLMLCYPRMLGYVFNPLTVYYGLDGSGHAVMIIYEVTNTFGERHTYAIPVTNKADGTIRQSCEKVFHVSPFNAVHGNYAFRTHLPGPSASIAILLKDENGPLLAAQFHGEKKPLTDTTLAKLAVTHGFMTAKVWLGIHFEALKLWGKRLRFHKKPPPPEHPVSMPQNRPDRLAA